MATEHRLKKGECIFSISADYGFLPDTIWNDPSNAELKDRRQDPGILYPGDIVVVPEKQLKEESRGTDQKHGFRRKGILVKIAIQFSEDGEPLANEPYAITPDIGMDSSGQTDEDGGIEIQVSPKAKSLAVRIGADNEIRYYRLLIGVLDPIDEDAGVQKRLHNLGYPSGTADMNEEALQYAVKEFQLQHDDLDANGRVNQATRNKLREVYGA